MDKLHICEIRPDRLAEVKALTKPASATLDYQDIVRNPDISVVYVCTTPETNHFPITRDCLKAGKHVLLEKPIALELWEADELITLAPRRAQIHHRLFAALQPKFAFAKKKIADGTPKWFRDGEPPRHPQPRKKIGSRTKLSPVAMESTHDLDFIFWLLEPAARARLFAGRLWPMQPLNGSTTSWSTVTMDNGVLVVSAAAGIRRRAIPLLRRSITGTEGALILDDTHRDNWLNTVKDGTHPDVEHAGRARRPRVRGNMGRKPSTFLNRACSTAW